MDILTRAKTLVGLSLDSDGLVDAERVSAVCEYAQTQVPPAQRTKLLKTYLARLKPIVAARSAVVESSGELSPETLAELVKKLERRAGGKLRVETKIDKSLLGGVRVKCGDDVFERSASAVLRDLQTSSKTQ